MAAARLAQARIEPLEANGTDAVDRDGELTGFGVRVRMNHVLQTRVRGKLRWFTIGHHPGRGRDLGAGENGGQPPRTPMRSRRPNRLCGSLLEEDAGSTLQEH